MLFRLALVPCVLLLSRASTAQNIGGYNDTEPWDCNTTDATYYNATSSVTVDAFAVPEDVPGASLVDNLTSLTFYYGRCIRRLRIVTRPESVGPGVLGDAFALHPLGFFGIAIHWLFYHNILASESGKCQRPS